MPKLNATHISSRIQERIGQLEAGGELEARDFEKLLNEEQLKNYRDAWEFQQQLRKTTNPKTDDEKREFGWKTKRDVRLDIYRKALAETMLNMSDTFKELEREANIRQAKIYIEAFGKAINEGKDTNSAKTWANNELTRAGLRRMDEIRKKR